MEQRPPHPHHAVGTVCAAQTGGLAMSAITHVPAAPHRHRSLALLLAVALAPAGAALAQSAPAPAAATGAATGTDAALRRCTALW